MFSVQSKYSKKTKSISLLGFVISNKTCRTWNVQIQCQPSRLSSPSRWKPNSLLLMQKIPNGFVSPQMSNFYKSAYLISPSNAFMASARSPNTFTVPEPYTPVASSVPLAPHLVNCQIASATWVPNADCYHAARIPWAMVGWNNQHGISPTTHTQTWNSTRTLNYDGRLGGSGQVTILRQSSRVDMHGM